MKRIQIHCVGTYPYGLNSSIDSGTAVMLRTGGQRKTRSGVPAALGFTGETTTVPFEAAGTAAKMDMATGRKVSHRGQEQ